MEVLGHWPIKPAKPNLPSTAQPHAGRRDIPPGVSLSPDGPRLLTLPGHTGRGHQRIVRAHSWLESFAQIQQTSANASLYGSKGFAGFFSNLVMCEPLEESHFQRRTLWRRH